jgi:hypothetical protein
MARLNNIMKFCVWIFNNLIYLIGFLILAVSLYVCFANWGGLDKSFFLGLGVVYALFGGILIYVSMLGILAIRNQDVKEDSPWTGKRIILLYLICVLCGFWSTAFFAVYLTNESTSLQSSQDALQSGDVNVPYDDFESATAVKFNQFFFGVAKTCTSLNLVWFWEFVGKYCPSTLHFESCASCSDNWITTCIADQVACDASYDVTQPFGGVAGVPHKTCPYDLCRDGIIDFIIDGMNSFLAIICTLLALFAWLVLFTTMLLCYHKRDSNEVYLMKAGAIRRRKSALGDISGEGKDDLKPKDKDKEVDVEKGKAPAPKAATTIANVAKDTKSVPSAKTNGAAPKSNASSSKTPATTAATTPAASSKTSATTASAKSPVQKGSTGSGAASVSLGIDSSATPRDTSPVKDKTKSAPVTGKAATSNTATANTASNKSTASAPSSSSTTPAAIAKGPAPPPASTAATSPPPAPTAPTKTSTTAANSSAAPAPAADGASAAGNKTSAAKKAIKKKTPALHAKVPMTGWLQVRTAGFLSMYSKEYIVLKDSVFHCYVSGAPPPDLGFSLKYKRSLIGAVLTRKENVVEITFADKTFLSVKPLDRNETIDNWGTALIAHGMK